MLKLHIFIAKTFLLMSLSAMATSEFQIGDYILLLAGEDKCYASKHEIANINENGEFGFWFEAAAGNRMLYRDLSHPSYRLYQSVNDYEYDQIPEVGKLVIGDILVAQDLWQRIRDLRRSYHYEVSDITSDGYIAYKAYGDHFIKSKFRHISCFDWSKLKVRGF